jgi:gliding motility-associated-like protein
LYKILLGFLLLIGANAVAQVPPNIGFENGTFSGWDCAIGGIDAQGNISVQNVGGPVYDRQTLISAGGDTDPYGHFPTLCPNGSKYSVRLGNDKTGAQAERLSYTFVVPPGSDYSLVLNYAVVLQNPDHQAYQQPKFTARVFNVTDQKYIDCPSFDFVASSDLPGFKLSDVTLPGDAGGTSRNASSIYYKEWSATTIHLTGYAGKTVTLEFTTNDCAPGKHFGYAYIDVNEDGAAAITGNTYCIGQPFITLHAPNGFYDYYWYNAGDLTKPIGHGETFTINPSPPDQSKYALTLIPYPGLGCVDTLYTVINKINEGFNLKVVDTIIGCKGGGADLTAAYVTAGSSSGMTLTYYTNPVTLDYVYNPKGVDEGTYYIQGMNHEGCMNILPVHVVLKDLPVINAADVLPIQYPQSIDLSTTFLHKNDETYGYYTNVTATTPLINYKTINTAGTYYIKAVNSFGCITIRAVTIKVDPPPPYSISGPNVFTPNNDGVNDYFAIKMDGFVSFGTVKIFNRYGQLLFTAKSPYDTWDGNYNGRPLPAGTYYWVFEGTDQYYHTAIKKASSITIAR